MKQFYKILFFFSLFQFGFGQELPPLLGRGVGGEVEIYPQENITNQTLLKTVSVEDWKNTVNKETDFGKKSHTVTEGTANAIITAFAATELIKQLPEIAEKLSERIKKVKKKLVGGDKKIDDVIENNVDEVVNNADEFIDDADNLPGSGIGRLSTVSEYLNRIQQYYPKVYNKIKNFTPEEQARFMDDFPTENTQKFLDAEDDLVDVWKGVKYLKNEAKSVEFLEWIKKAKNSHLPVHLKGEVNALGKAVGCHIQSAVDGSRVKILSNPQPLYNGTELVKAKIEIDGITKNALSTFFPRSWDEARAIEETALIMKNPSNQIGNNKRLFGGTASDGTKFKIELMGLIIN